MKTLVSRILRSFPLTLVLAFAIAPSIAIAGFGFKLDGTLDKEAISHAYFEGEFSRILPPLEMYRQSFPSTATKEDSIFVYKYLSVIYAADASTRNKGESCMVQLIKMKPTIELLDLYISDNIASIFKDVKQNYLQQQKYVREHDIVGNVKDDSASQAPKNSSKKWFWWSAAGIGTVAAVGVVYLVVDAEKSNRTTYNPKP